MALASDDGNTSFLIYTILSSTVEKAREFFNYRGPVIVEPSCFNERLFKPLSSDTSAWPTGTAPIGLIYMGSISERKGLTELLKAMHILPDHFCLTLIGRGNADYIARLEELRAAVPGGEKRIRFTGFVPQSSLRAACSGSHISVIPQFREDGFFFTHET